MGQGKHKQTLTLPPGPQGDTEAAEGPQCGWGKAQTQLLAHSVCPTLPQLPCYQEAPHRIKQGLQFGKT